MTEYTPINVTAPQADDQYPDVHLYIPTNPEAKEGDPDYGKGLKLDLPNLNSGNLPIDVVQVILMIKSNVVLTEEQNMAVLSTMLAYFQVLHPDFWNFLRRTGNPMGYLVGTVEAWAQQSGLDPKRYTSLLSTTTTPTR